MEKGTGKYVTKGEFEKILKSLDQGISIPLLAKKYKVWNKTIARIKVSREFETKGGRDLVIGNKDSHTEEYLFDSFKDRMAFLEKSLYN